MIDIKENMKRKSMNFECDACKKIGKRKKETQKHVYKCKQLNNHEKYTTNIKYKDIFGNNVDKMKQVMTRMNKNLITRKTIMTNTSYIPFHGPSDWVSRDLLVWSLFC